MTKMKQYWLKIGNIFRSESIIAQRQEEQPCYQFFLALVAPPYSIAFGMSRVQHLVVENQYNIIHHQAVIMG